MIKKKVILIGDYSELNSKSMQNYALLYETVLKKKINIKLINPPKILSNFHFSIGILKKWLGYIDNYLIFGFMLFFLTKKNDIVHICNHANSLFYPFIRSKNILITCHDLINIKRVFNLNNNNYPSLSLTGYIYQNLIIYFLKKFQLVICVSENTQKELIKYLKFKKKKTVVINNSIDKQFMGVKKKPLKFKFKYFLHVGNNNFYKNKTGLIKIFKELIKYKKFVNYKLILAGKKNSKDIKNIINKFSLENKVVNITDPSFNKLARLYMGAEALIFPSHEEGFGIPLIEAQYFGCLVVTTNKMPMKEILGKSCIYINPKNLSKSAKLIYKNYYKKKKLIKLGKLNASNYYFDRISNKYLELYKNIS